MKYLTFVLSASILILFFMMACSSSENDLPPIDKEKMQAILMDMYVAQAAAQFRMVSQDSLLRSHKSEYYPQILATHQITALEYETAYDFYLNHPETLHEIYDAIIEELTKMEVKKQPE